MMTKQDVLDATKKAVGDRGLNYGKPEHNFDRIAAYWRVHLWNRFHVEIELDALSVAHMMELMKMARRDHEPLHMDSIVDSCGYAACAGEIASEMAEAAKKEEAAAQAKPPDMEAYWKAKSLDEERTALHIPVPPEPEPIWNRARSGSVHG